MFEVSGSWEETPRVRSQGCSQEELPRGRGQWRPGGDTPHPRSGPARRSHLAPEAGAVTLRSHPEPEARGGSWEEPP